MEDRFGRAVLVGVAKMTFDVEPEGKVRISTRSAPIRTSSIYHPSGGRFPTVQFPSDAVPDKPGTDVMFVGTAHPPEGKEVTQQDVSVRVGKLHKAVRVFGRRVFTSGGLLGRLSPGPAEPLAPTPLRYELAYGGFDDSDPTDLVMDEHNPAGIGLVETRRKMLGSPAHRVEPLYASAEENNKKSKSPAGFGAIDVGWLPRRKRAGTHDDKWRRKRAPVAPEDFDPRFHSAAHSDLWSEEPLIGDEPVEILGATPSGVWCFTLPPYAPRFISTRDGQQYEHETHLDTFLINGDEGQVELTWRAAVLLPNKAQRLERITVRESQPLPETITRQESAA